MSYTIACALGNGSVYTIDSSDLSTATLLVGSLGVRVDTPQVAFSPDGKYLGVASSNSPYVRVYDVLNSYAAISVPAVSGAYYGGQSIAFSPSSDKLAIGVSGEPSVHVIDCTTWIKDALSGDAQYYLGADGLGRARALCFTTDGQGILVGGSDYNGYHCQKISRSGGASWVDNDGIAVDDPVNGLAVTSGHTAVATDTGSFVYRNTYSPDAGFTSVGSKCNCAAFSNDGYYVAFGYNVSPYLQVAHVAGGGTYVPLTYPTMPGAVHSISFSPDNSLMYVAHAGAPYLTVVDVMSAEIVSGTAVLATTCYGVSCSPSGQVAPAASSTFTVSAPLHAISSTGNVIPLPAATGQFAASPASSSGTFFATVPVLRSLSEIMGVFSSLAGQPTYRLLDALTLTAAPSTGLELSATLRETLSLDGALGYIANLLATENLAFTADPTADILRTLILAETLAMTSGTSATLEIAQRLLEQMTVQDIASLARAWTVEETLAFADDAAAGIEALLQAQETLDLAESIRTGFVLIAQDTLAVSGSLASTLEVLLRAEDTLAFIGSIPLHDGDYQAWVMNADTTGVTSYANFPMDSLFTHEGVPYGLTSTGLYRLEGDTDDGEPINAIVATGDLDFGTSRLKNVPRAYLYITQAGQCLLKTITSIRGSRHETFYELADRATDGDDDLTYRRVPLGRGVRGEWWRFEVHNVDGSDFDLDGAEVRPVALSRRG